ncbi:hypothetical protein CW712_02845 [Candidatus Bathyarchaeota archaeon]|nr:MAG: hypothetical protein CW712_02845 [Candidatus Bathyarchaeota archaeon]
MFHVLRLRGFLASEDNAFVKRCYENRRYKPLTASSFITVKTITCLQTVKLCFPTEGRRLE